MKSLERDFEKSCENCITQLEIIKANFGCWINQEAFFVQLKEIESSLVTLADEIFEAGFND